MRPSQAGCCCRRLSSAHQPVAASRRHHEDEEARPARGDHRRRGNPRLAAPSALEDTAYHPHHLRRPATRHHRPAKAGEYAADGGVQRLHRPLCRRLQDRWHLRRYADHDDSRRVQGVERTTELGRFLSREEQGDSPAAGQGEV